MLATLYAQNIYLKVLFSRYHGDQRFFRYNYKCKPNLCQTVVHLIVRNDFSAVENLSPVRD